MNDFSLGSFQDHSFILNVEVKEFDYFVYKRKKTTLNTLNMIIIYRAI